jgi:hypothetical protein
MTQLFDQLGYNYTPTGNEIVDYSPDVIATLDKMPRLLEEWQFNDLINNDVAPTNYFSNPVVNITNTIRSNFTSIRSASILVSSLSGIVAACNNGTDECDDFIDHTNRIAGLVQPNEETAELPHYDMAVGVGKTLVQLIYQADGIQNTAPVMGSLTSLFIEDDLQAKYNVTTGYATLITDSISSSTDPETSITTYISSLTSEQINEIISNINVISNTMETRRLHDENFYTNSVNMLEKFQELKRYSDLGESDTNLINNYIGTDRLKNNIANTA